MTSDVQRDQSALPSQQDNTMGGNAFPTTTANTPTDPPFISFPVTKTPGTLLQNMPYSGCGKIQGCPCKAPC